VPDAEAWCSAQGTYDAIRGELFRRAAQVRGSDEQAYTRLADFALLRMSGPIVRSVDEDLRSVTCTPGPISTCRPECGLPTESGRFRATSTI
jgi:hypothetical protein